MSVRLVPVRGPSVDAVLGRAVEKVADLVAQKKRQKRPFVVHPRYGYQSTGDYPKCSYVFQLGANGTWPSEDRERGALHAFEINVLGVAAKSPFQLCIGLGATFTSVPDGNNIHRVHLDSVGLLLTRIHSSQPLVFKGLQAGDSVQVNVEVYPSHMLMSGDRYLDGAGRITSSNTMTFAYQGTCFMYDAGKVVVVVGAAQDPQRSTGAPPSLIPSWLEFAPLVTEDNKEELAAAASVHIEPEWSPGQVAMALVDARKEAPTACYELDTDPDSGGNPYTFRTCAGAYFTVEADTGLFKTAKQGLTYAHCEDVSTGTCFAVDTPGIVRQIQCDTPFTIHVGPHGATTISSRDMGGVEVIDIPCGLPVTTQGPCTVCIESVLDDDSDGGGQQEGQEGQEGRRNNGRKGPTEEVLATLTFLCEAFGSARAQDLGCLAIRAVSTRNVIVAVPAAQSKAVPPTAATAMSTIAARAMPITVTRTVPTTVTRTVPTAAAKTVPTATAKTVPRAAAARMVPRVAPTAAPTDLGAPAV